jgi:hypothetical protein
MGNFVKNKRKEEKYAKKKCHGGHDKYQGNKTKQITR